MGFPAFRTCFCYLLALAEASGSSAAAIRESVEGLARCCWREPVARRLCAAAALPDTRGLGLVLFLANCSLLLPWLWMRMCCTGGDDSVLC